MQQQVHVLLLEDSEPTGHLLHAELERLGRPIRCTRVDTKTAFQAGLQHHPDLILAKHAIPEFGGENAFTLAKETVPSAPFIAVLSPGEENVALEMLRKGASDFVFTDQLARLLPAVERALRESREQKARREAEEAYRDSMDRYRRVVENATEMIFTTDEKGMITYANGAAIAFLGYTMGELWTMTYLDLTLPEFRRRAKLHYMRRYLSGELTSQFEVPVRAKDGSVRWVSQNVSMVMEKGELRGFQVISRDVTERKRLEEAYLLLVDHSLQGFAIIQDGRIMFVNQTLAQDLGYSREDLPALSPDEFLGLIHPDDLDLVSGRIRDRLSGKDVPSEYEFRMLHKNGSTLWFQIHAVLTEYLGKPAIQGSMINITAKKKAEEELGKAEDRFSKIFHANPVSIALSTLSDGKILDMNKSFERMSGYTRDEMVGKTVAELDFWVDPGQRQSIIEQLRKRQRLQGLEAKFKAKGGELRYGFLSFEIVDLGGNPVLLSMAIDITEKKRAEEELRQYQERLQAVINGAPIILWAVDRDGRFTLSEGKGLEKLGLQPGELVGKSVSEVFGEEIPALRDSFEAAMGGKETERLVPIGPVVMDYRYTVVRNERGQSAGLIGVATDVTEQKRIEKELQESEVRMRLLLEGIKDYAIYMLEPKGHIISWNAGAERIKGYREDEALGRHISVFHPREDRLHQMIDKTLARAVEEGRVNIEGWRVRKDGSLFWASSLITPLLAEDELLRGFAVITKDDTERKRAENALRESEERFRLAFEDAPNGMVITALNGVFLKANQRMCMMMGYSQEELHQRDLASITHPDDRAQIIHAIKDMIRGATKVSLQETRCLTRSGDVLWIWLTSSLVRDSDGNPLYFVSHVQDITEQKKAREIVEMSEKRFATLFRSSPAAIGMGIVGADRFLDVNERYCEFFGYNREELLSHSAADLRLWADDEDRERIVADLLKRKSVRNVEAKFRHKSGSIRDGLLSMVIVEILGEQTLISMLVDITSLKTAEEQLRSSTESLRALSARLQSAREDEQTRIAREIHDELGQALTGLKMDLVWLEKRIDEKTGKGKDQQGKIRSMFSLIDDTIKVVRRISAELRPGALDDLGLVAALEWQLNEFAQRTTIKGKFSSSLEVIPIDRERSTAVFRIFQETLTNVARHSGATRVSASLERKNQTLRLEVRDNGRGITREEIENKISLGLLGMRERALVFNGTVDIHGKPGKGTTVTVLIPLEKAARKAAARKRRRKSGDS